MSTCDLFTKIIFLVNTYASYVTVNTIKNDTEKRNEYGCTKMSSLSNIWLKKSHYDNDLIFAFPQIYMLNFNRLKVNILKIYGTVSTDIYYKGKDQMGLEIGPLSIISNATSLNRHRIDPSQILPNRL